jgi:hypothetical protein
MEVRRMELEIVDLVIEIFDNDRTMLSYRDKGGVDQRNSRHLTVTQLAEILVAYHPGNFPSLVSGRGRRTEDVELVLDNVLKEALGFNDAGEILR